MQDDFAFPYEISCENEIIVSVYYKKNYTFAPLI